MFLNSWKARVVPAFALGVAIVAFSQRSAVGQPPPNKAPVLTTMNLTQLDAHKFTISGTVSDNTPSTCKVTFTGKITGTVNCDASGNFSYTAEASDIGNVTGTPNDGSQNGATLTKATPNSSPTVGGLTAVGAGRGAVTFSGTVTDEFPSGLTVVISATHGSTYALTLANGSFTTTMSSLPPGATGTATFTAYDQWGATGTGTISYTVPN